MLLMKIMIDTNIQLFFILYHIFNFFIVVLFKFYFTLFIDILSNILFIKNLS